MKYTIMQFQKEFPNDDVCLDFIFKKRFWSQEQFNKYYRVKGRKCFAHSETGQQIHPTSDTIFHKSRTSLVLWFFAIFLFSQSKNGVSAKELQRQLGVTYKCAYRMGQQIRSLMDNDDDVFGGTVEIDETYVGWKGKEVRGRGAKKKTPVLGMVERKGSVSAYAVGNVKSATVTPMIEKKVSKGTTLMTDEYGIYNQVGKKYDRQIIKHSSKEYVRGNVHTNTIEGFWSHLKNSIKGTYRHVSKDKLQVYINEFTWKYNHRNSVTHHFPLLLEEI